MEKLPETRTVDVSEYIPPTIREQLRKERDALARKLMDVDHALKLLDKNPKFEEIHDAITRCRIGGLR